jgi:hypothetical protein
VLSAASITACDGKKCEWEERSNLNSVVWYHTVFSDVINPVMLKRDIVIESDEVRDQRQLVVSTVHNSVGLGHGLIVT